MYKVIFDLNKEARELVYFERMNGYLVHQVTRVIIVKRLGFHYGFRY